MKRLIGIVPLITLFLVSCATHKNYHVVDGKTYFRVPAQISSLDDAFRGIDGGVKKVLEIVDSNKKHFNVPEGASIKSLDDLKNYQQAYNRVVRNFDMNDGKFIWKSVNILDISERWAKYQGTNPLSNHRKIVRTKKTSKSGGSILNRGVNYIKNKKKVQGGEEFDKLLRSAVDQDLISGSTARRWGEDFAEFSKSSKDAGAIQATLDLLDGNLAMLKATNKKLAFFNPSTCAKKMGGDADAINKLAIIQYEGVRLVKENPQMIPTNKRTKIILLGQAGDHVINPNAPKAFRELAENSEEFARKYDEWGWRGEGFCGCGGSKKLCPLGK